VSGPHDTGIKREGTAHAWLEAAVQGLVEVAPKALSCDAAVASWGGREHVTGAGAIIALIGDHSNVDLVFVSTSDGCECLARALCGMAPDEDIVHEDVADAICEIANVVAGVVKRHFYLSEPGLTLGLPVAFEGRVLCHAGYAVASVRVGTTDVQILAVKQDRGEFI
jgi:CheY-specific phosphatase CheX